MEQGPSYGKSAARFNAEQKLGARVLEILRKASAKDGQTICLPHRHGKLADIWSEAAILGLVKDGDELGGPAK